MLPLLLHSSTYSLMGISSFWAGFASSLQFIANQDAKSNRKNTRRKRLPKNSPKAQTPAELFKHTSTFELLLMLHQRERHNTLEEKSYQPPSTCIAFLYPDLRRPTDSIIIPGSLCVLKTAEREQDNWGHVFISFLKISS